MCSQYQKLGYCATYTSVQSYCPFSCNLCAVTTSLTSVQTSGPTPLQTTQSTTPTGATTCKDTDSTLCSQYQKLGYCATYTSVQSYCPFSCNLCTVTTLLTPVQTSGPTPLQTTPSTTPTGASTCKDTDSALCSQYQKLGYCINYASVQSYCPFSCNLCGVTTSLTPGTTPGPTPLQTTRSTTPSTTPTSATTCKDTDSALCSQYQKLGYCINYASVQSYCPFSCNLCGVTTSLTPIQTTTATITTGATTCKDTDSTLCSQYQKLDYCATYTSVQSYCPLSCKVCSISG